MVGARSKGASPPRDTDRRMVRRLRGAPHTQPDVDRQADGGICAAGEAAPRAHMCHKNPEAGLTASSLAWPLHTQHGQGDKLLANAGSSSGCLCLDKPSWES